MTKRTVKVTISHIERRKVVNLPVVRAHCAICGHESEVITTIAALQYLQTSPFHLEHLILQELIHSVEMVNGALWICKDSLFKTSKNGRRQI